MHESGRACPDRRWMLVHDRSVDGREVGLVKMRDCGQVIIPAFPSCEPFAAVIAVSKCSCITPAMPCWLACDRASWSPSHDACQLHRWRALLTQRTGIKGLEHGSRVALQSRAAESHPAARKAGAYCERSSCASQASTVAAAAVYTGMKH